MSVKEYRVRLQADIEASSPEAAVRVLLYRMQSESTWASVWRTVCKGGPCYAHQTDIAIHEGQVISGAKCTEEVSE